MGESGPGRIRCLKCNARYDTPPTKKEPWKCPECGADNPNLRHQFTNLAAAFIAIGAINGLLTVLRAAEHGIDGRGLYYAADTALLLITAVAIRRSRAPWASRIVAILVWVPACLVAADNLVVPLFSSREVPIVFVVLYILAVLWLIRLFYDARQSTL